MLLQIFDVVVIELLVWYAYWQLARCNLLFVMAWVRALPAPGFSAGMQTSKRAVPKVLSEPPQYRAVLFLTGRRSDMKRFVSLPPSPVDSSKSCFSPPPRSNNSIVIRANSNIFSKGGIITPRHLSSSLIKTFGTGMRKN